MSIIEPVVGISYAMSYDTVQQALRLSIARIGGIKHLVYGKTVAVKVNWSGWGEKLLDRPATETYVVHPQTLYALVEILLHEGAHRVVILESAPTLDDLALFAIRLGCDVDSILRLGNVDFINTRNGGGHPYARLPVREGLMHNGRLFEWFDVHRAYAECEVFVSLAKMKNHTVSGVTLTLKNLVGILPNSLYGLDAPSEGAVKHRQLLHSRKGSDAPLLPGEHAEMAHHGADVRIPFAIADLFRARPIDLAVVEGVTTVAGGEGPWFLPHSKLRFVNPGVVIVGRDAVATDAVSTAVMGYADPLSTHLAPFARCENHILLAHKAGLGVGDLALINVRGVQITAARTPFS